MNSYFEITENDFFSVTADFNLAESIDFNHPFYILYCLFAKGFGHGIFDKRGFEIAKLNPQVNIEATSLLPLGAYTVTGLLPGEQTVLANLDPNGEIRIKSTIDPRLEIVGSYYYNSTSKIMKLSALTTNCLVCSNLSALPISSFSNIVPQEIIVSSWNEAGISGRVPMNGSLFLLPVNFTKIEQYSLDGLKSYATIKIKLNFPNNSYNNQIAVVRLNDEGTLVAMDKIVNQTATTTFMIEYGALPAEGVRHYELETAVLSSIDDMVMDADSKIFSAGLRAIGDTFYTISAVRSSEIRQATINFIPLGGN